MDIEERKDDVVIWKKQSPTNILNMSDEDVWDDTALVKAYDKAIAQLREGSNVPSTSSQSGASVGNKPKKKNKSKKVKNDRKKWKVDEPCLALYEEDGLYYEASVIYADNETHSAKVKYSYYGNEEDVSFDKLLPIHNRNRMNVALNVNNEEDKMKEDENDLNNVGNWSVSDICFVYNSKTGTYQQAVINSFTSPCLCHVTIIKSAQKREVKISQLHETLPNQQRTCYSQNSIDDTNDFTACQPDMSMHIPPPPPPFLNIQDIPSHSFYNTNDEPYKNMFDGVNSYSSLRCPQFPSIPEIPSDLTAGKEEAMANMLMSWYMSGYHTGYFQGLQNKNQKLSGKKKNRNRSMPRKQMFQ